MSIFYFWCIPVHMPPQIKILSFLFFFLLPMVNITAQTIKMEKDGGVYKVPCKVNGLALKFIFDTGASDVSISSTEALFMLKNGYLNEDDLGGSEYYRIANGDIAEGTKVTLRKIEIGDKVLFNVEASIVHSIDAPLLLGQSVMERLGQFTIDYATNSLIIGKQSGITNTNAEQLQPSDYPSVKIGNQVWMTENLNVDRFRNGEIIPHVQGAKAWNDAAENKQPAWCYYNNDPANGPQYGKLYNWYAVADARGLCPAGWHIPSDDEWTILTNALGGEDEAENKMKSKSGWAENSKGNNSIGFTGLPGGYRTSSGSFDYVGEHGFWWSSTEDYTEVARYRTLGYSYGYVYRGFFNKGKGFSVRCLRD
jgi:clan AA aspartic protease (TIGR02281 family)